MIAVIAAVAAGAAGAVLRYLLSRALAGRDGFPVAVFVVNVVGSGVGGAVLGLAQAGVLSGDIRLILLGGLCGGLTTFSTFSVETIQLVHEGRSRAAALNVALNLLVGVAAAVGGYLLVAALV